MEYTTDWFLNNIPLWEKTLFPLAGKPLRVLEIGCFEGRATVWLLQNILTHPDSQITCIDPFTSDQELHEIDFRKVQERFLRNTIEWKEKVDLHIGRSAEILPILPSDSYDLIYVDGSHLAKDALIDGVLSHLLLKEKGIIIFDDYLWNTLVKFPLVPKGAIDAFMECFALEYDVLYLGHQVILQKKKV